MSEHESPHRIVTGAVTEGWVEGSAFLGSILAGWILGWLMDRWLDTDPWFVVIGIILGIINGFFRMWILLNRDVDVQPK